MLWCLLLLLLLVACVVKIVPTLCLDIVSGHNLLFVVCTKSCTCARSDRRRSGARQSASAAAAGPAGESPNAPTRVRDALTNDTAHEVSSLRALCNT